MRFPTFKPPRLTRIPLALGGLCTPDAVREGGFFHTEQLITEGGHTVTHPPRRSLTAPAGGRGMCAVYVNGEEQLCYIAGGDVIVGQRRYSLSLSDTEHRLIPFGSRILIFPERKYLSPEDGSAGELDAALTTSAPVLFTLCRSDGSPYTPLSTATDAPEAPAHGDFWLDTAFRPAVLRCFSAARQEWQTVTDTCLRIGCRGIGAPFRRGDTVTLSGIVPTELARLNGTHILSACEEDHLVIPAAPAVTVRQLGPLTVSRRMPEMNPHTMLVHDGRLYGVFQGGGEDGDGTLITHIYASRPGDPVNRMPDESSDTDGARQWTLTLSEPITAATVYGGTPHFFTEHGILKLVGQGSSARFALTPAEGVRAGCGKSLREVNGKLLYLSLRGMMQYDGHQVTPLPALPYPRRPRAAAAGVWDFRYYLSVTDTDGRSDLLVYDTAGGLWSRLDSTRADDFVRLGDRLCYRDGCDGAIRTWESPAAADPALRWSAQTAPIRIRADGDRGRVIRLELALCGTAGSEVQVLIGYDGAPPREALAELFLQEELPAVLMLHPRPAAQITLQLQGRGAVSLDGLTLICR